MICGRCGRQNPAGARYCIHCGTEQAVPTPIAAVAAAVSAGMGGAGRARAANAAHVGPAVVAPIRALVESPVAAPSLESGVDAGLAAPEPPAYDSLPRRRGLGLLLLGVCLAAGIVGAITWYLAGGGGGSGADGSIMAAYEGRQRDVRKGVGDASPVASAGEAAPRPSTGPQNAAVAPPGAGESAGSGGGPAREASSVASLAIAEPAQVEIRQLPALPAPARSARHPAPAKAAPPAPPVAQEPAKPAEPPPQPTKVASAPAAPVVDRWGRMNEELSQCTREDFITRVICSQRVRFHYCDGYWGKTPQCPANPAPERGQ